MDVTHISSAAEVRQFCEAVSESATKNLRLLKAVEQTVQWLSWIQDRAQADAIFAGKAAVHLRNCDRVTMVDVDGTLGALLEDTESSLDALHQLLKIKSAAASSAADLHSDDKIAVLTEYSKAIAAVADLHNLMVELRWAAGEHESRVEPGGGDRAA